jgi:hypothetical protein
VETTTLLADRRASIAMLGALAMTAMMGVAALAIDIGVAYTQKAKLQKISDSAALAGAISWVKLGSNAAAIATISAVVTANGLPAGAIQQPALFYLAASPGNPANAAIQVKLAATTALTLGRLISSSTALSANAWSIAEIGGPQQLPACLVALTTLMVNSTVTVNGCAVAANSSSSNAITVNSGGSITASRINTPGGVINNGHITGIIKTGGVAAANPYSAYAAQAAAGFKLCKSYSNQMTLTPGCWSNVNINGGMAVTLSPGAYFFTGLNVNSGGSLTGTGGVTIITQSSFSPNGPVTLTAPTTGSWAGMAIYATGGLNVNSGVLYTVNGGIYSPTTAVNLNSSTWNQAACTYLVASSITFNSGSTFTLPQTSCATWNFPTPTIAGASGKIVLVQ